MRVRLIPALSDNYMYLLVDEKSKTCAIVDPVEPEKVSSIGTYDNYIIYYTKYSCMYKKFVILVLQVLDAVREENVKLTTVLTTHHHWYEIK